MARPPESPPHSDLDGVHQDGTGPGKIVRHHDEGAEPLEERRKQSKGHPAAHEDNLEDRPEPASTKN